MKSSRKDITGVEAYAEDGMLLDKVNVNGSDRVTVNVRPGVILIRVTREGNKTSLFKYMVQ